MVCDVPVRTAALASAIAALLVSVVVLAYLAKASVSSIDALMHAVLGPAAEPLQQMADEYMHTAYGAGIALALIAGHRAKLYTLEPYQLHLVVFALAVMYEVYQTSGYSLQHIGVPALAELGVPRFASGDTLLDILLANIGAGAVHKYGVSLTRRTEQTTNHIRPTGSDQ